MKPLLVVVAVVLCSLGARADDSAARKALTEKYSQYDKAVLKGANGLAAWCETNLATDFKLTAHGGSMNREQFIGMCKEMAKHPDPAWGGIKEQKVTIDKLTETKDSAVAEITVKGTMIMKDAKGQHGPKGAEHKISQIQTYREAWVKSAKGWKVKKSEQLSEKMTMDGKEVKRGGG